MPHILEQFTMSKTGDPQVNEDRIYTGPHFLAVIDGSTSKTAATLDGKTGGQLAAACIAETLAAAAGSEDAYQMNRILRDALSELNQRFDLEARDIDLCASAVIYSIPRREIWSIGDCQCSINGQVNVPRKKVDELLSELRAMAIHALLLGGMTEAELLAHDTARDMIHPLLKAQTFLENADDPFGYSVLSVRGGLPTPVILPVPRDAVVILASDGYPQLAQTLEDCEALLAKQLAEDPLCYKTFLSTKGLSAGKVSYDDRSFLHFTT